jgi:hypothetical protein
MSAADRPGWFFANQVRPIPRQLEDGIRLLLIDTHYGVVDAQGRVRTDLTAEGTDATASRAAWAATPCAPPSASRAGSTSSPAAGKRQVYLCHTLCELGAERMRAALDDVRGFLERNPSEVVVVLVESSIRPSEVVEEVEKADLEPYVATLRRGEPLPTLRELVASRRRLVARPGRRGRRRLVSARRRVRAGHARRRAVELEDRLPDRPRHPESPLFLVNHWIDRFPPPLTGEREVNDRETLVRRVRRCREVVGRRANLLAVDFYDRGGVVAAARELNRAAPSSRARAAGRGSRSAGGPRRRAPASGRRRRDHAPSPRIPSVAEALGVRQADAWVGAPAIRRMMLCILPRRADPIQCSRPRRRRR